MMKRPGDELQIPLPSLESITAHNLVSVHSTVHNTFLHDALVAMVNGIQMLASHINSTKAKIDHVSKHVERQDQAAETLAGRLDDLDDVLKSLARDTEHNVQCLNWCQNEVKELIEKQKRDTAGVVAQLREMSAMIERIDTAIVATRDAVDPLVEKVDAALRTADDHRKTLRWASDEVGRVRDRAEREYTDLDSKLTRITHTVLHQSDGLREARQALNEAVEGGRAAAAAVQTDLDRRLEDTQRGVMGELEQLQDAVRRLDTTAHTAAHEVTALANAQRDLRDALARVQAGCSERQRGSHAELNAALRGLSAKHDERLSDVLRTVQAAEQRRTLLAAQIKAAGRILHQIPTDDE